MIYTIPEYNIKKVVKKLDALNTKALKLGVDPIMYSLSAPYSKTFTTEEKTFVIPMVDLDMTNSMVSLNGWAFLAVIEHSKNGNIIMKKLYDVEVPEYYRTSGSHCDHCNTDRYRKNTYLVYNKAEDKIYQVGSTCINNYLGFDAAVLVSHATLINQLSGMLDDDKERARMAHRGEHVVGLDAFMKTVLTLIGMSYYVSAKMVRDGKAEISTGAEAWDYLVSTMNKRHLVTDTDENNDTLKAIYEWLDTLTDTTDYISNVKIIVKNGYVTHRTATTAASIAGVYFMDLAKKRKAEQEAKNPNKSEWIGEMGDRLDLDMTLETIRVYENQWGIGKIYTFSTWDGNTVVWFSSSKVTLEEGCRYKGKGTVKNFTEFKGHKQTVVTRCILNKV